MVYFPANLLVSLGLLLSSGARAEGSNVPGFCAKYFAALSEADLRSLTSDSIKKVQTSLSVSGGQTSKIYLSASSSPPFNGDRYLNPLVLYSYKQIKPGFEFSGPDGAIWKIEELTGEGIATISSGAKKLKWKTGIYEANTYSFAVSEVEPGVAHTIEVVIPVARQGAADLQMLENLKTAIAEMPKAEIKNVKKINLHALHSRDDDTLAENFKWLPLFLAKALGSTAGMASNNGVIDLFRAGNASDIAEIFRHELGHMIAFDRYGTAMPNSIWIAAAKRDGRSVSGYATVDWAEDFAETCREYFRTDAGTNDSTLLQPSHQKFHERFRILDEFFAVNPEAKRTIQDQLRNVRRIIIGSVTGVAILTGTGIKIFYANTDDK